MAPVEDGAAAPLRNRHAHRRRRTTDTDRVARACAVLAVAAAVVPVVVATVRAVTGDWVPLGDNAYFAIRARDVFGEHHPFLGTWTSASLTFGTDVNNPGPLYFDVLAPFSKLGSAAGTAIGVAVLNVSAIAVLAWCAHRRLGAAGVAVAAAGAAGLVWSMGSELLFDPWQPHALLLASLAFLVSCWAMTDGDHVMLPVALALGSLLVQTHLSYAYLVPTLCTVGLVGVALQLRGRRRDSPDSWPLARRGARRSVLLGVAVFALCWVQPLWEQFQGPGEGNISRLVSSLGAADETVGAGLAARVVASIVALPPWWGRPSVADTLRPTGIPGQYEGLAGTLPALAGLALVVGGLVLVAVVARRRHDGPAGAAAAIALVALGVSFYTSATLPLSTFGVAAHQVRPIWPVAVFVTGVLAVSALRLVSRAAPLGDGPRRSVPAVAAAVAVVVGALALPAWNPRVGPTVDADAMGTARALTAQLDGLVDEPQPIVFDDGGLRFAEPYSIPVLLALHELGIEFTVAQPGLARQLGESRTDDGQAELRLYLREGVEASVAPPGSRRVAFVAGLDDEEEAELRELTSSLTLDIERDRILVDGDGRTLARALGATVADDGAVGDEEALLVDRLLAALVENDMLRGEVDERWVRWSELARQRDRQTVSVFLGPADELVLPPSVSTADEEGGDG